MIWNWRTGWGCSRRDNRPSMKWSRNKYRKNKGRRWSNSNTITLTNSLTILCKLIILCLKDLIIDSGCLAQIQSPIEKQNSKLEWQKSIGVRKGTHLWKTRFWTLVFSWKAKNLLNRIDHFWKRLWITLLKQKQSFLMRWTQNLFQR
jgi:hypothetical protein